MSFMLSLQERINAFSKLGDLISNLGEEEKSSLFRRSENQNTWFIPRSLQSALEGISFLLKWENLEKWLSKYSIKESVEPKEVGILMAGNIPGVGFHDLLCVLITGHIACVKLSSSDSVFSKWIIDQLILLEPRFSHFIRVEEMLKGKDAYIATGSDNSARYFEYYFGKYPHIIRANRTSVAILSGEESEEELRNLGNDIFQYFGLGCRNVSKIYVKDEECLTRLLDALAPISWVASHHKYLNNYEYNKSIYLVNGEKHLDNGFLILKESQELVSPIGVLFYEKYESKMDLEVKLKSVESKIQCVVGDSSLGISGIVPFGQAQLPGPWDYADRIDTIKFLLDLS